MLFVARTVARKTQIGQRQTVQQEDYYCHVFNNDGLVGVAFVDHDYPARAGFSVVNKVMEDFEAQQGSAWRGATADTQDAMPVLEGALEKYQVSEGLVTAAASALPGLGHLGRQAHACARITLAPGEMARVALAWQQCCITGEASP